MASLELISSMTFWSHQVQLIFCPWLHLRWDPEIGTVQYQQTVKLNFPSEGKERVPTSPGIIKPCLTRWWPLPMESKEMFQGITPRKIPEEIPTVSSMSAQTILLRRLIMVQIWKPSGTSYKTWRQMKWQGKHEWVPRLKPVPQLVI